MSKSYAPHRTATAKLACFRRAHLKSYIELEKRAGNQKGTYIYISIKQNAQMTTKEKLTAKLKELGFNSRQVSVSRRPSGYSSAYAVTIRDVQVNPKVVEAAVEQFEKIDRCPATHEILSGGNTFINVGITEAVRDAWAAHYVAHVEAAIEKLTDDRTGVDIIDGYVMFMQRPGMYSVSHFQGDGAGSRIGYNSYYSAREMSLAIYRHKNFGGGER